MKNKQLDQEKLLQQKIEESARNNINLGFANGMRAEAKIIESIICSYKSEGRSSDFIIKGILQHIEWVLKIKEGNVNAHVEKELTQ